MEQTFQEVKYPMVGFYDIEWQDCYQITLHQSLLGQNIINRFFYECANYTGAYEDVLTTFESAFLTYMKPTQSQDLQYVKSNLTQLFDARNSVDHFITSQFGTDAGNVLPAFFGARYQLVPSYSRVRKGRKIFAGVTELMTQGDDLAPGYVALFAALAGLLDEPLNVGEFSFAARLLSPANTKHPTNVIAAIQSAAYVGWSTQSSRKIGRGT